MVEDPEVDQALASLAGLDELPVEAHLDHIERVHARLRERLEVPARADAG